MCVWALDVLHHEQLALFGAYLGAHQGTATCCLRIMLIVLVCRVLVAVWQPQIFMELLSTLFMRPEATGKIMKAAAPKGLALNN